MILIIQVPLKQHKPVPQLPTIYGAGSYEMDECYNPVPYEGVYNGLQAQPYMCSVSSSLPSQPMPSSQPFMPSQAFMAKMAKPVSRREKADVEEAIIKVGDSEGRFREIGNVAIERDHSFPIRVTLQYYKATSNGVCDDSHIRDICNQLKESRKFGSSIGSLVVGNSNRPTEIGKPSLIIPLWFDDFWLTYGPVYTQFKSKLDAAEVLFVNGRFTQTPLQQCRQQVLDILGSTAPSVSSKPTWGFGV